VLLLAAGTARAQHLEPRTYANTPVGMHFLIGGLAYSNGGLATDPALPLTNAKLDIHAPFVAYAHAFDAWGKSAKFDTVFAAGCLDGTAETNGVPVSRDVCGALDPTFRLSINMIGAPALQLKDFAAYRQDVIVGASLQVQAPLGQYDPTKLVNLGSNRWGFRPEIGISKAWRPFTVEVALSANLYTTNHEFFGGKSREQEAVYSGQLHLIYEFSGGAWAAFNANYFTGGRSSLDGVPQNDELGNSRFGLTLALPWDRRNSVKLYVTDGVSVRAGEDFTTVGLAWQHRWGGGL
jgi:hypothetical protein